MRTRFATVLLGSVLVLGLSSPARAGDPPAEDPASMLRRARVAETVDHDLPKAMDLYRKVFAAGGDSDTSRDAALHLMDLLEARGDRPGALEFAKTLTDRFGSRLDDAMKRQVHETMARTLPAGSHARSPLGDVYVLPAPESASNPAPSPLETKILAILSRLDVVEDKERNNVEVSVLSALAPVGRDALPVLERVMNDSRPERARFAAQAFAKIGQKDALPGLVKAIREGDGFARASAVGGLAMIEADPDASPAFVAAVEPLLRVAGLSDLRARLVPLLGKHVDAAACLDRFESGGEFATYWLYAAGSKDGAATAERLWKSMAGGASAPSDERVSYAGRIAGLRKDQWVGDRFTWALDTPAVSVATRQGLLAAIVRGPASTRSVAAAASIAGAIRRTGSPAEQAAASSAAWGFVLDAPSADVVAPGVADLARYGVEPAVETLASGPRGEAFQTALATICASDTGERESVLRTLFQPALLRGPVLWAALERTIATSATDPSPMTTMLDSIRDALGGELPPATEDARWLRVLDRPSGLTKVLDVPALSWMRRAAARMGEPRLLDIARARIRALPPQASATRDWCADLVAQYRGPGRSAFALDMIVAFGDQNWGLVGWALDDAEFWPLLAKRLGEYSAYERKMVLSALSRFVGADAPPPPEFDALWLPELRRPMPDGTPVVGGLVAAAARSGSPEYAAILKELLLRWKGPRSAYLTPMVKALPAYPSAGRRALLLEFLSEPAYDGHGPSDFLGLVWDALNADPDAASLGGALDTIAKNPAAPGNDRAVWRLATPDRTAELVELYRSLEKPGTAMRNPYRNALASIANSLHLKEAIPFLLKEYREGHSFAMPALDEIRAFYDRVKAFEGFADGKDPLAAEIDAAKTGATVELRRAAVFALAATHGAKAVPALLDLARTTADEPVRKAAIEMIEQIARGAPAGTANPPAPAAPSVPAPTPGVDEPPTGK